MRCTQLKNEKEPENPYIEDLLKIHTAATTSMPVHRYKSQTCNCTANGEHCISYSNTQADSLRFSYSLTTGSTMTLKRFELVEQCEEVLLVANILNSQDYYPFGMVMPGRSFQGSDGYRYGFNGQEKDDEIAGSGNSYTAQFWQYDSRLGRRWNTDPVVKHGLSPYSTFRGNPVGFIDPFGDTEYESYEAYKEDLGDKAVAEADWTGQDGHWLASDRSDWESDHTMGSRFSNANELNITTGNGLGSGNYVNLKQREAFYSWFQYSTESKGFETKWAGGAAMAVDKLEFLVDGWCSVSGAFGYSSPEIESWVKSGNQLILDDVWGNLKSLYGGPVLVGQSAYEWDVKQLVQEQLIINDSYWNLSNQSLTTLQNSLQKNYFLSKFMPGPKLQGSLLSVKNRWVYGMTLMGYKVNSEDIPLPEECPVSGQ